MSWSVLLIRYASLSVILVSLGTPDIRRSLTMGVRSKLRTFANLMQVSWSYPSSSLSFRSTNRDRDSPVDLCCMYRLRSACGGFLLAKYDMTFVLIF